MKQPRRVGKDRPDGQTVGTLRAASTIGSLKWHLLLGGLRGGTGQRIQSVLAIVVSVVVGALSCALLWGLGASSSEGMGADVVVVLLPVSVFGIGLVSAATGVESSLDPRNLATEPLGRWELGVGVLVAAAIGPPSLLALLSGLGIVGGWASSGASAAVIVVAAVVAWWVTLLLFSRTFANVLGAMATGRLQQVAQVAAALSALLAWVMVQVVARDTAAWTQDRWDSLSSVARWTPPGQLGAAIVGADDASVALLHLLLGVAWLPILLALSVWSTQRLALSAPRPGGGGERRRRALLPGLERVLPAGRVGAIAERTLRTKLRTPRQAVNTISALAIGAGVFLVGPVLDPSVDPRVVLVGGVLHFAVLFDGNNAFGMDGPAIWSEIYAGADGRTLVRGKVVSSLAVMTVPALVLPVALAAITGGWQWVVAGWLVAIGSVLGAAGVAVASATLAPVAMPDSPNPLAAGDTGQGCVAGLALTACMTVLMITSVPVGLAVYLASGSSAPLTTLAALGAPVVGALVMWGAVAVAVARLSRNEDRMIELVTPAR